MSTMTDLYLAPVIHRTCLGLLLCSLSLMTQAAQPKSPQWDLSAVQLTHINVSQQSSYRFSTTVASITPNNLMLNNTLLLPAFSEFKKGIFCITSICLHLTTDADDNHTSFLPQFRLGPEESRIEIRPLQRSVLMTWRRALP